MKQQRKAMKNNEKAKKKQWKTMKKQRKSKQTQLYEKRARPGLNHCGSTPATLNSSILNHQAKNHIFLRHNGQRNASWRAFLERNSRLEPIPGKKQARGGYSWKGIGAWSLFLGEHASEAYSWKHRVLALILGEHVFGAQSWEKTILALSSRGTTRFWRLVLGGQASGFTPGEHGSGAWSKEKSALLAVIPGGKAKAKAKATAKAKAKAKANI